jgi:hypothetical protein
MKRKTTKMEPETLKALKSSIAHYDRMIAGNKGYENILSTCCALCARFNSEYSCSCRAGDDQCPVAKAGFKNCKGSPWDVLYDHIMNVHCNCPTIALPRAGCSVCKKLLQDERRFLRSLLPKGAK